MKKRIIRLTESELVRLVKRVINEVDLEPVYEGDGYTASISFREGNGILPEDTKKAISRWASNVLSNGSTIQTILQFQRLNKAGASSMKIPPFIEIYIGTSSTGSYGTNRQVAETRLRTLRDICVMTLTNLGIREDVAFQLVVNKSDTTYSPTHWDEDFFDTSNMKPIPQERKCFITILPLKTKGLVDTELDTVRDRLVSAKGYNINPDEWEIVRAINQLETYSDIESLNRKLKLQGGLQGFINSTITNGILADDIKERTKIVNALNRASNNSGKGQIATYSQTGDSITITGIQRYY